MDQAVDQTQAFSSLYTAVAELSGLPRNRAKMAIIKTFLGIDAGPDWLLIIEAYQRYSEKARREED